MDKAKMIVMLLLISILAATLGVHPVSGRETPVVQEIRGYLGLKDSIVYRIPGLKQGDTLTVYLEGLSENLDPLIALLKPHRNIDVLRRLSLTDGAPELQDVPDPLEAIARIFDTNSYIWNDDYQGKYRAAFQFTVPADGSYRLLVRGTPTRRTTGKFRLLIGVNAPAVLKGTVKHNKYFVLLDEASPLTAKSVQETKNVLSADNSFRFHNLTNIQAGETLYLYIKAVSGDLIPTVTLYDFGEKPLANARVSGEKTIATLQYTFAGQAENCRLKISGHRADGTATSSAYRLLLGINAPEVLTGEGIPAGRAILKEPIPVSIGIKMHQITHVDQKSENFGVVATLLMEWQDQALAFNPEDINKRNKIYNGENFRSELNRRGILWPEYTIYNQQGNRWAQNNIVVIFPDGRVIYVERFTTTLQAPDFNFRKFPFDVQHFFIRADLVAPEWYYKFVPNKNYSAAGEELGEEEWIVTSFDVNVDQAQIAERPVSRFNFHFQAQRHLAYYIFRIFLPLFIILAVSWVVFFLKDYNKRIDIAGANLLLFIAFNFTISSDLPRLGYLTFMDAILISAFVVTALVLILSVFLQRLATSGKQFMAMKIDMYVVRWLYPVAYVLAVWGVTILFG